MKRSLPLVTLIALGAAAYAPLPSMAQTDVQLYIGTAPPAPLYERMPSARRGHVWVPGYWAWNGRRHHWMPGTYIVERPGYVYAPPAWQQRGGRWYMQQGGWAPHRGDRHYAYRDGDRQYGNRGGYQREVYYDRNGRPQEYRGRDRDRDGIPDRIERHGGDTDRDGIPNARDRDRDNDGVENRYDHDRDGDGRRNSRDSSPDNPYRR
ncbi:YXWGXW repeat-containing protein [Massilia niabensis]|uniref:BcpO-related WXXGXW repeat protein n=1 Tax=Massilia niabensis TaxID=544910 RepID=A0ABW0L1N6_9BURK